MSPTGLGTGVILGVGKETSYGTRVQVTERVPLLGEGIAFDYQDALHEYLYGGAATPGMKRAFEPVTGTVEANVCYTVKNTTFVSVTRLIAMAMGTTTWDTDTYEISFADDLSVFGTIAIDKGQHATQVWQAVSCFVNGFTLSCNAGESLQASFDIQAYDLMINDTTNTVAILAALATDLPELVMFSDFVFSIGDHGGVLGAGDQIALNSFTISVNNNLTEPEQTTLPASGALNIMQPIQPVRNGFREVTLEIVVPRYTADTFFDFQANDTSLQATFVGTGSSGGGSEEFDILFPNLKVTNVSVPVEGAEALMQTITFRCLRRNSTSDITWTNGGSDNGELWIETDDGRDTGDLALS